MLHQYVQRQLLIEQQLLAEVLTAWDRAASSAQCSRWRQEAEADRVEAAVAWAQAADLEVRMALEAAARSHAESTVAQLHRRLRHSTLRDVKADSVLLLVRIFAAWGSVTSGLHTDLGQQPQASSQSQERQDQEARAASPVWDAYKAA